MSSEAATPTADSNEAVEAAGKPTRYRNLTRSKSSLLSRGEPILCLTNAALVIALVMVVFLMGLIIFEGLSSFKPMPIKRYTTEGGTVVLGQPFRSEVYEPDLTSLSLISDPDIRQRAEASFKENGFLERHLIRSGNHKLTGSHFTWVADYDIAKTEEPEWATIVERLEWGRAYGELVGFKVDGETIASTPQAARDKYDEFMPQVLERRSRMHSIKKHDIGGASAELKMAQLAFKEAKLDHQKGVATVTLSSWSKIALGAVLGILAIATVAGLLRAKTLAAGGGDPRLARFLGFGSAVSAVLVLAVYFWVNLPGASAETLQTRMTEAEAKVTQVEQDVNARIQDLRFQADSLDKENSRYALTLKLSDGRENDIPLAHVVHSYQPNRAGLGEQIGVYFERWSEFLWDDPRESNSEGGVFPAIFGTVIMTLLMTIIAVPFGVLAALYLREYAKSGPIVSIIRVAINNLAGVPSIVFGVFGLGFFCYTVGGWVDGGPAAAALPVGSWLMALSCLTMCIVLAVAFMMIRKQLGQYKKTPMSMISLVILGVLLAGDLLLSATVWVWLPVLSVLLFVVMAVGTWLRVKKLGDKRLLPSLVVGNLVMLYWMKTAALIAIFIYLNPFFEGFYRADLPNPHYGTGGIMWASFTLALLTLPVVIVATEEALQAVPNSMREGSYACGASRWQTIWRIVLPRALPGIMTGMILAMARGAGEVAPLMMVGAVKLAPELPLDLANWTGGFGPVPLGPLHPERSFMHLGFHIYDLGFQSPNAEAARPMVYTTAFLLIGIVFFLNLAAIKLRTSLVKRFSGGSI